MTRLVTLARIAFPAAVAALVVSGCTPQAPTSQVSTAPVPAPVATSAPVATTSAPVAKSPFVLADQVQAPGSVDLVGKVHGSSADAAKGWSAVLQARDVAASPAQVAADVVSANVALGFAQSATAGSVRLTGQSSTGAMVTVDVLRPAPGSPVLVRVLSVTATP